MLTQFEIELAQKLTPKGFEFVRFDDEAFTRAFISCFRKDKPLTVIIGAGGSGKSVILKMVAEIYGDKALCLAPTGVAAHNLETSGTMARTIHSGLILPMKPYYDETEIFAKTLSALADKKILLIDEISMVNSNLLDTILRHVASVNLNRRSADSRIRTVLFGDPLQLSPVFDKEKLEPVIRENPGLQNRWDFFHSQRFKMSNPDIHVLEKVFRQDDNRFKAVLDHVRKGRPTDEDIDYLNSKVSNPTDSMLICPTNYQVDMVNQKHIALLSRIETPLMYNAEYILGDRIKDCGLSDHIEIYLGERVMCTRNCTDEWGTSIFQNGTVGEVISFELEENGDMVLPVVKTDDGRSFTVPRMEFSDGTYRRNTDTGKLEYVTIAAARQIPLKPCYALTYHKSQGLTLDSAHLVMPSSKPPSGLLYMGLSRVKTPEGLTLSSKVTKDMFSASKEAKLFLEKEHVN